MNPGERVGPYEILSRIGEQQHYPLLYRPMRPACKVGAIPQKAVFSFRSALNVTGR